MKINTYRPLTTEFKSRRCLSSLADDVQTHTFLLLVFIDTLDFIRINVNISFLLSLVDHYSIYLASFKKVLCYKAFVYCMIRNIREISLIVPKQNTRNLITKSSNSK